MNTSTHKRCPVCRRVLHRDEFYRRSWYDRRRQRQRTRTSAFCRACERAYQRERSAHLYRTDPGYRARKLDADRRYRQRRRRTRAHDRRVGCRIARYLVTVLVDGGMPCTRVAAALGVHRETVYRWRRGQFAPTPGHLAALRALVARTQEEPDMSLSLYRCQAHLAAGGVG